MKTIFYISFVALFAEAKAPECNVTSLTNDCRIFDAAPAEIKLPDGTSFPNPRHPKIDNIPGSADSKNPFGTGGTPAGVGNYGNTGGGLFLDPEQVAAYERVTIEGVQAKSKLAKALSAEKNMSEDFKMNLLADPNLSLFYGLNTEAAGKFSKFPNTQEMRVKFFWPPNGKDQSYKDVSMSEIIEFLNSNKVSTQTKTALSNALSIQRKSSASFINENQKAQRESERQQQALLQHMQKRKARATELIDVAKRSFKKVFDQNASQKDAESLKKTIDNLNFKFEDELPASMTKSCKNGPNAFYNPAKHTFVICNSVLNYPDNQLVGIIGHEMGHSISSCSLSLGLDKINPQILDSFIAKPSTNANSADNKQLQEIKSVLSPTLAARIGNDYIMSESFVKYADEVKLYTPLVRKIEKNEYPFAAAKECLVANSKFREMSLDDSKKLTNKAAEVFKEADSPFTPNDHHDLQKRNDRMTECLRGFDHASETDEAISDMWGSIAMEEYLNENPPKTDLDRLSLYSFFGSNYCEDHEEKAKHPSHIRPQQMSLSQLKGMAKLGQMVENARMNALHPPSEVRLNEVYFSMPKIAESLGCSPTKNATCFEKLKNFARTTPTQSPPVKDSVDGRMQK